MSKIIRTRKPSVLPYYAAALVFVVLCAVLPVYRLWALAAALAAAAAAFLAAKKVCPPRVVETEVPFHTGVEDVDAMLADIQQKLDTLHSLNESLPDPQLSAAMTRMEKAGRSIVEVVEANPAKAKQVRRFANYYLPDAVNVLQQYAQLARQGVRGENAAAIRAEVERNVENGRAASKSRSGRLCTRSPVSPLYELYLLHGFLERMAHLSPMRRMTPSTVLADMRVPNSWTRQLRRTNSSLLPLTVSTVTSVKGGSRRICRSPISRR